VLIQKADYNDAMAYLRTFDAKIYEAELDEEAEKMVIEAAENRDVARAVGAE